MNEPSATRPIREGRGEHLSVVNLERRAYDAGILGAGPNSLAALERRNPNLVGGDIGGGANTLRQLFARPTLRLSSTPAEGLYICSASTPPGGGIPGCADTRRRSGRCASR
ncbi:MAG: hypothetical protein ACRD68_09855 [Pyrinomonadaceae bacterium]